MIPGLWGEDVPREGTVPLRSQKSKLGKRRKDIRVISHPTHEKRFEGEEPVEMAGVGWEFEIVIRGNLENPGFWKHLQELRGQGSAPW